MSNIDRFMQYLVTHHNDVLRESRNYAAMLTSDSENGVWHGLLIILCTTGNGAVYRRLIKHPRYDVAATFSYVANLDPASRRTFFVELTCPMPQGGIGVMNYNNLSRYLADCVEHLKSRFGGGSEIDRAFKAADGKQDKLDLVRAIDGIGDANAARFWCDRLDPDFFDTVPISTRTRNFIAFIKGRSDPDGITADNVIHVYRDIAHTAARQGQQLSPLEIERVSTHFMEHIAAAFSNASDTDATDTSRLARTLLQTALTFLNSGSPVQYYVPVNRAMPLIAQFASMIDARIAAEQYDPIATFAEAESMVAKSMVAKPIVPAVG